VILEMTATSSTTSPLQKLFFRPEFAPLVLAVGEIIVFAILSRGRFLSASNISNLLAFVPELGMIALAMTLLMIAGEFDLSVGSVFGFTPVLMWTLFNQGVASLELSFIIAIVVAIGIGLANGWFVTQFKIPSFLVTLGMLLIVRGTALYITSGFPPRIRPFDTPPFLVNMIVGSFYIGGIRIYASLLWFIFFAIILGYVLSQTKAGNWIQATGGNAFSARARGVKVIRTKVLLFVLTAVMSAYAGITSSIRVSAANPTSGDGYELEVIAMVVIGGTALMGGRGTIAGTILGIFILRLMRNGINFTNVEALAYNIFIGAIIIGMMVIHSQLERRHNSGV
jgi:simple sugar transport system permease protein